MAKQILYSKIELLRLEILTYISKTYIWSVIIFVNSVRTILV